ncbi:cell wall hydrolase [Stakelama sp. CBK3Z-3]|uniref:Cell wall hydrolase n=2 Tax=Stakelama flava TaxID=2860338 RepID=A0ABS6XQ32_9SPHN|nr:cell wall hydrolase [Stakelama flava]
MEIRTLIAAALALLAGAGFSAHAALASLDQMRPPAPVMSPKADYDAGEHFPGSLYYTMVEDDAAVARGVTGTTALPDMPASARADAMQPGIVPARPFRLTGSAESEARARECLTSAIYYEAAREPDDGQQAVAQVILNRVAHPAFPDTVCGVVYQGSERAGCQFSFACDGSLARAPDRRYWRRARDVAVAALSGHVFAPVGLATHYHTYAVRPAWNRKLVMTGVFGAHFFHRWAGWWGTAAAFHEVYAGGEPVPGPHRRIDAPPVEMVQAALPLPAIVHAAASSDRVAQATPQDDGEADPHVAVLPQSQILDKWKDSGKPLR